MENNRILKYNNNQILRTDSQNLTIKMCIRDSNNIELQALVHGKDLVKFNIFKNLYREINQITEDALAGTCGSEERLPKRMMKGRLYTTRHRGRPNMRW